MAEGPRARVAELPAPQGADARPQPAHGVRGSALPQHRRVLEPRDGDLHDPRRRLHARLLILRRRARPAGGGRCRGARARRPRHPDARPQLRRHHLGGPRRPAGWRRDDLCRNDSPDSRAPARLPDRSTDPGLSRERRAVANGARRRPRRAESQHRDRSAALSHGALRRPVRADTGAAGSIAPLRAGHPDENRRDGRPRGATRRTGRHLQRICAASAAGF